MRKGLAFSSAGLTFAVLCALAVACGDDGDDNVFKEGTQDASFDTGPGFNHEDGGPGEPITCKPSLPATFKPAWIVPTQEPTACSPTELGEYYDACLKDFGKKEKECTDWLASHADCGGCIQKEDNSGAVRVYKDPAQYVINQGGCVALVTGKIEDDECGALVNAFADCRRQSCDACFAKGGDFGKPGDCSNDRDPVSYVCCLMKADTTGCASYKTAQAQKCPIFVDPDGGAPDCTRKTSDEPERDFYIRAMGVFCSSP